MRRGEEPPGFSPRLRLGDILWARFFRVRGALTPISDSPAGINPPASCHYLRLQVPIN